MDGAVVEQFPVSGAQLYTEARGAGPLLLLIVGGNGDPAVFSGVADRLAGDFTVVTYARRGFARSPQAVGLPGGPAAPPPGADVAPEIAAMLARAEDNMTFWMEHEFRQYPAYHPDFDALAAVAESASARGAGQRPALGSHHGSITDSGLLARYQAAVSGG